MSTPLGGETLDASTQGAAVPSAPPRIVELRRARESAVWAQLFWDAEVDRIDQEIASVEAKEA